MVGGLLPYGPSIAEHVVLAAGLEPGAKLAAAAPTEEQVGAALAAVWLAEL
jgi:hypothetical protein